MMMEAIDRAIQLMDENKTEEAIQLMDKTWPKVDQEMQLAISDWYNQLGFLEKANEILQKLLIKNKRDIDLRLELVDNYLELGEDEKALSLMEEIPNVNKENPEFLRVIIQEADLYQAQGLFEVAEEKLLYAKRQLPSEPLLDLALGELLFSIGRFRNALIYYEALQNQKLDVPEFSLVERMAEAYAGSGQYEQALNTYAEANITDPGQLFNYALTAFQARKYQLAIKLWKELLTKNPDSHIAYLYLAKTYAGLDLFEEAYETCLQGLEVDEFNKELYFETAFYAEKLGKIKDAKKYIQEAVALDPDYREAVLFLIAILKDEENHEEIIDMLQSIREFGALDPYYEWELASSYNEINDYSYALKHFREAYTELIDDGDFLKEYGYFLIEDGKRQDGVSILEKYLSIHPEDEDVMLFIERIKEP